MGTLAGTPNMEDLIVLTAKKTGYRKTIAKGAVVIFKAAKHGFPYKGEAVFGASPKSEAVRVLVGTVGYTIMRNQIVRVEG